MLVLQWVLTLAWRCYHLSEVTSDLLFVRDLVTKLDQQELTNSLPFDPIGMFSKLMNELQMQLGVIDQMPTNIKEVLESLSSLT